MLKDYFSTFNVSVYVKLVFVMLLCVTVICGCGMGGASQRPSDAHSAPTEDLPTVVDFNDTELGKQIRQDYFNYLRDNDALPTTFTTMDKVRIKGYYGVYNGYVAVIMDDYGPTALEETIIAGILFVHDAGNNIIVWKNGEFYKLQEIYNLSLLTREDILDIANSGRAYDHIDHLDGNHAGLSLGAEKYLCHQYYIYFFLQSPNLGGVTRDDIWIEEYYGTYNGYLVMMMDYKGSDYTDDEREVIIADIPFRYNNGNSIIVWARSGPSYAMFELQKSYDLGFLTQEDLSDIADQHNSN